jgi:hypothetical protein
MQLKRAIRNIHVRIYVSVAPTVLRRVLAVQEVGGFVAGKISSVYSRAQHKPPDGSAPPLVVASAAALGVLVRWLRVLALSHR